jgi:hypothetical protein
MGELDPFTGPIREILARGSRCLGHRYQGVACAEGGGWRRGLLIRSSSSPAKVGDQNEKAGWGADATAEWDDVERRPLQTLYTAYMALVQRQTQALRKEFQSRIEFQSGKMPSRASAGGTRSCEETLGARHRASR